MRKYDLSRNCITWVVFQFVILLLFLIGFIIIIIIITTFIIITIIITNTGFEYISLTQFWFFCFCFCFFPVISEMTGKQRDHCQF